MFKQFTLAAALLAASAAQAQIITQWNFNSTTPDANTSTGVTTPSIGAGTASLLAGVTGAFNSGDANGGSSDPATGDDSGWQTSTYAAQGTGDRTRGVQFNVSTVGFSGITVTWDQRVSNTSSRFAQFQYSTDGTNFADFGALFSGTPGDAWYNSRTVSLVGLSAVDNNANFAFRVVSAFEPATTAYLAATTGSNYATTGTWRFDMVTVSAVPEPGTYAMMFAGLVMVGFMAARRSR
jgi:hypothetical protein